MDEWDEHMFKYMQKGGNLRLKQFLNQTKVPFNISQRDIIVSKLMGYYRKLVYFFDLCFF